MRGSPQRTPEGEPSTLPRSPAGQVPARPEIQEALEILRQRKWSIIGICVLLAGVAIFFSSQQTPIYSSEAAVLVTPVESVPEDTEPIALNVATEREVAESEAVAEIVAENLDLDESPRDLLEGLSVDNPPDTEIIQFGYNHADPAEAQRRADGFARGYLEYRRQTINEVIAGSAEALEGELGTLNQRLGQVEAELDRLDDDDLDRFALESEAQLLQGLILDRQLDRVALSGDVTAGRVIQSAALSSEPVSPNHVVNAAFGLAAGLALGIGLAFLRDRLSGRLRSDDEVEVAFGAPVIGVVPRIPAWRRRKQAYLVTRSEWGSPSAETYRILRTNLLSTAALYDAKSFVVTSANIGEGKTATASNLAVALAKAGKQVVLVSADLRRPRLQEFFPTRRKVGLTDVLAGSATLAEAVETTQPAPGHEGLENLSLLGSGSMVQDTSELLSSDNMVTVLEQLKARSDFVLVDAPPVLPVTDAMILARIVDGVLFVIGPRSLTYSTVSAGRQQLEKVGANVMGIVLNGTDLGAHDSYYTY